MENMRKCFRRYVAKGRLADSEQLTVVDLGGADINGSFRSVFADARFHYVSADLAAGPGVTLVLDDPYRLPLDDRSVDVVLSGQVLEHCEFFWMAFAEMVRVLKPGGYIFLIVPSAGPIHRYPVDCYRFYPDSLRALAKYANCRLVESWLDERGPWKDLVGVFARHEPPPSAPPPAEVELLAPQFAEQPGADAEEASAGDRDYLAVLKDVHESLAPALYLEIGVRKGLSLALADCASVAVDPAPELKKELPASKRLVVATSDDFFEESAAEVLTQPPDLVFIDGQHLFEFALRDFMNVERLAAPHTLVLVDDVFPNHPAQAERNRRTRIWSGDVWKLHDTLARYRPDLVLLPLNTAPTGMLMIAGLDPKNRVLWERYNSIVGAAARLGEPSPSVLGRAGAIASALPNFEGLLAALRQVREGKVAAGKALREFRPAAKAKG
jgi:predicted O-methyltransferase YrrM